MTYDPSSVSMPTKTGAQVIVYTNAFWDNTCQTAADDWACVCNFNNRPCVCNVKVIMTKNEDDIRPHDVLNTQAICKSTVNLSSCELDCSNLVILINATDQYTQKSTFGTEKIFYYMDQIIDPSPGILINLKEGYKLLSLSQIIEHELGHVYGLVDSYTAEDLNGDGYDETKISQCLPDEYLSVMDGVFDLNKDANKLRLQITNDDECMFKRLYCRDAYTYKDDKIAENLNQYNYFPNPSSNFTNIEFSIIKANSSVKISVVNELGNKKIVLNEQNYEPGNYQKQIDLSDLTSGVYFISIQIGLEYFSKKVIVLK